MKKLLPSFLFLFLMLTSCGPSVPGVVTVTAPAASPQAATATPLPPVSPLDETLTPLSTLAEPPTLTPVPVTPTLPTFDDAPSTLSDITYSLDALMDYDAKSLTVTQQTSFTNSSGVPISEIVLAVTPNQLPNVFTLRGLSLDGAAITAYELDGQRLQFAPPAPIQPGATATLRLDYDLVLPKIEQGDPNVIRPQIFGVTERQVNLTDWYPMLVPFNPQTGWLLHDPWYYGEHLVYPLADFNVTLRFVDPLNAPLVAASGATTDGARFILKNGRTFAFALGRQMQKFSAEVNDVTINSYYYPGFEIAGQAVLDTTVKSVQTYSELFGPYPHSTLAAVQGDFNDGMEFDGLYYLSNAFYNLYDRTPANYLVMVAAHETSHQWWFGAVASDQAEQPWLDEALATYCERLFYEKNHPESLPWWWGARIDFYQPEGKIDGTVASYGGFTPYTNATYRQGARFYEELRQRIGDEAFFAFLKDYYAQMSGKIATPQDFFDILRTNTTADYSDIVSKYFTTTP